LSAAFASAEVDYDVSVRAGTDGQVLHITMTVPTGGGSLSIQSPRWGPGGYSYGNYGNAVEAFAAKDDSGATLKVDHPDFSTWTMAAPKGKVTVDYELPTSDSDTIHYAGPRTYLYVVGRTQENCGLKIELPKTWNLRMGLDPVGDSTNQFTAPTYDVLADTPVTMGHFFEDTYTSHGKPHYIVMYGANAADIDKVTLKKICQFTSDAEGNFFGEVPYKRYVWHFNVSRAGGDGGGGLEHLNGTEISIGTNVGPLAQSVITHEFFHLWNVKRIRAKVLGPFDYTVLPKTGALWWLEGVTDYYAIMIPSRYGWWDLARAEKMGIARNIASTEGNEGRMQISPYDSSYRVNEANNGRGNSNGLFVSYYNTGWVLGLMLDIELRVHSHGKHSLDDVELALWNLCKNNKPGFEEDEIRKQCVRLGGPEMGTIYDDWVMKPGVLPVEDEIAKIGLKYVLTDGTAPQLPIRTRPSAAGLQIVGDSGTTEVITDVNGRSVVPAPGLPGRRPGRGPNPLAGLKIGDSVTLTVVTTGANGKISTDKRTVTLVPTKVGAVTEDPNATPEQIALRNGWISPRPGTKAVGPAPMAPAL
jgi:predicted metalloprotease with PDZ domain